MSARVTLPEPLELDPIEIDPRPCGECGLTIDRHRRVDALEGPEFYCDDLEIQIHLDACALVRRWELADPRDRWKWTGGAPPALSSLNGEASRFPTKSTQVKELHFPKASVAQSTIDAFWYVVRLGDADYLGDWLDRHPLDAPYLVKLLSDEGK
jgi:hypothetical protein